MKNLFCLIGLHDWQICGFGCGNFHCSRACGVNDCEYLTPLAAQLDIPDDEYNKIFDNILNVPVTTFSEAEAPNITADHLELIFKSLERSALKIEADHLAHNGCARWLKSIATEKQTETVQVGAMAEIYGLRVYERDFIPNGEVWLCDKDGKPIRRFIVGI